MITTINKLIEEGYLVRDGATTTLTEYRPAAHRVLALRSSPHAADVIEWVFVPHDTGEDRIEAELVPMLGHDHTKYIEVNRDISIKIFHEIR